MVATRLLESHKDALKELARRVVDVPAEAKAEDLAYRKAAPLARKIVEATFPVSDMLVLAKYELSRPDDCIRIQHNDGSVDQFVFHKDDAPRVADSGNCRARMFIADERASTALTAWRHAFDAKRKALSEKQANYCAFIDSARTFEQVLEIWPEAEELGPRIRKNLPVALSESIIESIKADSVRRIRQAAKTNPQQVAA